jgi:hypothetical protein
VIYSHPKKAICIIMAEYTDGMKEEVRAVFVFCSVVVWKETCGREPARERI